MSEDIIKITKIDDIYKLLSELQSDTNSFNLYRGQRYYPDKQLDKMYDHNLSLKPSAWRDDKKTEKMYKILDEFIYRFEKNVVNTIEGYGVKKEHLKRSLAEMVLLKRFCEHANKMALYLPHAQPFGFSEHNVGDFYHWMGYISTHAWGYLAPLNKIVRNQAEYRNVTLAPEIFITLSLAQHHGIPTRLLDWSFAPLKAIYFALNSSPKLGESQSKPALIKFKYSACNGLQVNSCSIENPSLINMVPAWTNSFLHSQEGVFTYTHAIAINSPPPSLEEIIIKHKDEYKGEPILEIFILDGDIDKMKSQIKGMGVSKQHLFPAYKTCTEELFSE